MPQLTIQQAFDLAVGHHQAGRLQDAEALYRQILAWHPEHAEAIHFLGLIALQAGRHAIAADLIRQAIALKPDYADAHGNLAHVLKRMGQLDDSIAAARRAIALRPDIAEAYSNLGDVLRDKGQLAESIAVCRHAIALKPQLPEAHNNLGNALKDQGQLDEAIAAYRQALALRPDYPEAHNNLGNILREKGRLDEAIAACRQAIVLRPNFAEAHHNLGNALQDNGQIDRAIDTYRQAIVLRPDFAEAHSNLGDALRKRGELEQAIAACRRAIVLRPAFAHGYSNLGNALRDKGQLDESIKAHRQAIALKPDLPEAHNNLGNALKDTGRLDEAVAAYSHAIAVRPDFAEAYGNLGLAMKDKGDFDQAIAAIRHALTLRPQYAEALCNLGTVLKDQGQLDEAVAAYRQALAIDPGNAPIDSNLVYALHFHPAYDGRMIAGELSRWNSRHASALSGGSAPHSNDRSVARRLRIGYVSPDFRRHPVGLALLPVLEHHDSGEFEIVCLSNVIVPDAITAEFQKQAHAWRSLVGLSDEQVAALIRREGIDILVDLTLHMANNRLLVFARKPAPVQVTWLGYPGSTGLNTMDYRLSDPFIDPPGEDPSCVEKTLRLPHTYLCWRWSLGDDRITPPPMAANGHVTFGCLNNFGKVGSRVLTAWARILQMVPRSRLILRCPAGEASQRVQGHFAELGISRDRLELIPASPAAEYVRQIRCLDICLDPFPYPGHTTSCDALWMGVPVVTLAGATSVLRGGVSLLCNIGLPELIAVNTDQYVELAVELAGDPERLTALRMGLRDRMLRSPLLDSAAFARDIENAYRLMWRAWCEAGSDVGV